jgi:hypothetical protein
MPIDPKRIEKISEVPKSIDALLQAWCPDIISVFSSAS